MDQLDCLSTILGILVSVCVIGMTIRQVFYVEPSKVLRQLVERVARQIEKAYAAYNDGVKAGSHRRAEAVDHAYKIAKSQVAKTHEVAHCILPLKSKLKRILPFLRKLFLAQAELIAQIELDSSRTGD